MSGKKASKKKPSRKKPAGSSGVASRIPEPIRENWKLITFSIAGLIAVISGAIAFTVGLSALRGGAERVLLVADDQPRVEFDWPTTTDGRQILAEVDRRAMEAFAEGLIADDRPLSATPLRALITNLEQSDHRGWFDGSLQARRTAEGTVKINAVWREPFALVRSGGADHLVSRRGMPMPRTFQPGVTVFPVITGVAQSPGRYEDRWRRYAERWPGDDFAAGLVLLDRLREADMLQYVAGVDVAGFGRSGPSRLVLRTAHGASLLWGGPVDVQTAGEASVEIKLTRIPQAVSYLDGLASADRGDEARAARIDISGLVAEIGSRLPGRAGGAP